MNQGMYNIFELIDSQNTSEVFSIKPITEGKYANIDSINEVHSNLKWKIKWTYK